MPTDLLFDLDGTLTDPKAGIFRSLQFALDRMGRVAPPDDELGWMIGPPLQHALPRLLGTEDAGELATCLAHFRERYAAIGLFENEVYEGIDDVLAELRQRGHRLFVATSKPKTFADRILAHFGLDFYFHAIHGSELDGRNIAKGDLIASLLAAEGLDPRDCLMIGDREHDVIGAHANAIRCIGVLYGHGTREELEKAGADGLCETPQGISAAVLFQETQPLGHR